MHFFIDKCIDFLELPNQLLFACDRQGLCILENSSMGQRLRQFIFIVKLHGMKFRFIEICLIEEQNPINSENLVAN